MLRKPFKPPLLSQRTPTDGHNQSQHDFPVPDAKRRRISAHAATGHHSSQTGQDEVRGSGNFISSSPAIDPEHKIDSQQGSTPGDEAFYNVLWRKPTNKKHKTWDGDGMLLVAAGSARLFDDVGKEIGNTRHKTPLFTGSTLFMSGREVEIESSITKAEFTARRPSAVAHNKPTVRELDEQLRTNVKFNSKPLPKTHISAAKPLGRCERPSPSHSTNPAAQSVPQTQFKNPLQDKSVQRPTGPEPTARHDPNAPGAIVMNRIIDIPRGKQLVDVVVDPVLSKELREHQREGVKFMYDCVMGLKPQGINGCILADEMGLGKTLQVVTLLWTLLKQNPVYEDPPVVKKAVIVCPVTVIKNWRKEIRTWLRGENKMSVFILDGRETRLKDFTHGRSYNVMIVGYEKLLKVQSELQKCSDIGIVVADEGHRLKTAKNKAASAIKALPTDRRIILSGTPLQNDLSEFYYAVDMINPGLLGKANVFKREFETPITRGRQPDATSEEVEKGEARSAELAEMTALFMMRRGSEILAKYLPPKTETILFCRPTYVQAQVYRTVLGSPVFGAVLHSTETAFKLINTLKKLCNSPNLLKQKRTSDQAQGSETLESLLSEIPSNLLKFPGASGKLQVLDAMLHQIRTTTREKVVIVSHYTSTIDIIEGLLDALSYRHSRLDGNTAGSKRQGIVDRFNKSSADECFAFLLSAKSGGAGINLIGASRLILFDVDWNPSTDEQAMARIHRDGQKHHCRIYRLLTQGALDEKIFQRQVAKRALAEAVVDGKVSASTFTSEELRRLFQLDEDSACQTHTLLGCTCEGRGVHDLSEDEDEAATEHDASLGSFAKDELPLPRGDDEDADGNDDLPDFPTLMRASQVDMKAQEKKFECQKRMPRNVKQSDKQRMLALMQYAHIDPASIDPDGDEAATDLIDDEILLKVLQDSEHKVGYIFTKTKSG